MKQPQHIIPGSASLKSSLALAEKDNQVCSEFQSMKQGGDAHVKFVKDQQIENNSSFQARLHNEKDAKPKSILK